MWLVHAWQKTTKSGKDSIINIQSNITGTILAITYKTKQFELHEINSLRARGSYFGQPETSLFIGDHFILLNYKFEDEFNWHLFKIDQQEENELATEIDFEQTFLQQNFVPDFKNGPLMKIYCSLQLNNNYYICLQIQNQVYVGLFKYISEKSIELCWIDMINLDSDSELIGIFAKKIEKGVDLELPAVFLFISKDNQIGVLSIENIVQNLNLIDKTINNIYFQNQEIIYFTSCIKGQRVLSLIEMKTFGNDLVVISVDSAGEMKAIIVCIFASQNVSKNSIHSINLITLKFPMLVSQIDFLKDDNQILVLTALNKDKQQIAVANFDNFYKISDEICIKAIKEKKFGSIVNTDNYYCLDVQKVLLLEKQINLISTISAFPRRIINDTNTNSNNTNNNNNPIIEKSFDPPLILTDQGECYILCELMMNANK
eukprot:TRINITY_DN7143_c4_g1_i1.p1 TRINITY_DN7143_c4_g1~~TRINITY_DN7143_c4_g1_i1.p1  ORF type:complete len:446 (-),score=139.21 TRINITY_DN7143_c4_g1_i1:6-1295(-)